MAIWEKAVVQHTGDLYRVTKTFLIAHGELNHTVLEKCRKMGQTIAAGCDLGIY